VPPAFLVTFSSGVVQTFQLPAWVALRVNCEQFLVLRFTVHWSLTIFLGGRCAQKLRNGRNIRIEYSPDDLDISCSNSQIAKANHHTSESAEDFLVLAADCRVVAVSNGEFPIIGAFLLSVTFETEPVCGNLSRFAAI
jgi:hypothetical protein